MSQIPNHSILSFPLDDPSAGLKFSERLARENHWSAGFTARALIEYKRFLVLCANGRHPMTPSDVVDQVWHMHMCYTDSYWNQLCGEVLGKPLHHGPTKGGESERSKYHDWYERTLSAYEEVFGEAPPRDIWPPAHIRFGRQDFKRIDVSSHFVVPRKLALQITLGTGAVIAFASCSAVFGSEDPSIGLGIFIIIVVVVFILIKITKGGGKGGGGGSGGGCGWFGGDSGGGDSGGCGGGGCGGGGGD